MSAAAYYQLNQMPQGQTNHPTYPAQPIPYHQPPTPGDHGYETAYNPGKPAEQPLLKPHPVIVESHSKPSSIIHNNDDDPSLPDDRLSRQKVQKYSRFQRVTQLASKAFTVVFSSIMFGLMVWVVDVHQKTKDVVRRGRTAWPLNNPTKVWPTYMLLAASALSVLIAVGTLIFYCCAFERASRSWKLTLLRNVVGAVSWIVVSVVYRIEKSYGGRDDDIWGWSCSPKAQAIQAQFADVISFKPLCRAQSHSWRLSVAEFAFRILFAILMFVLSRKKERVEARKTLADRTGVAVGGVVSSAVEQSAAFT